MGDQLPHHSSRLRSPRPRDQYLAAASAIQIRGELGALPTAVPCARLHARHLVWEWGLNGLADSRRHARPSRRGQARVVPGGGAEYPRWDWYLTQEPTGKVVWCELDAKPPKPSEGAQSAPQALLPRRVPREQQKQQIKVMDDPDLLRRLRDRLRDLSLTGDARPSLRT